MPRRIENYRTKNGDSLNADRWNGTFEDIDSRIAQLEDGDRSISLVLSDLTSYGLIRIEEGISPTLNQVAEEVSQRTTEADDLIALLEAKLAEAQSALDGFQDLNSLSLSGNISALNLAGTNTGDEPPASAGTLGLVRTDSNPSGQPVVYLKSKVDTLIASLQSQIDKLSVEARAVVSFTGEAIGAYGGIEKSGTSTHTAPNPGYFAGIVAKVDGTVVTNYAGIAGFTSTTLNAGQSIAVRTASFRLSAGSVIAFYGKPN